MIEQIADAVEALERAGVPVAADSADVLLAGDRHAPTALVAPLDSATGDRPPAAGVAEMFATLAGPEAGQATAAARHAAASGSPSAVAAAARAALPARRAHRKLRRTPVLAVAGLIAIAGVTLLLISPRDSGPAASLSSARIAPTVPIGGAPSDIAVPGHTLWVTTDDGRLVHVDVAGNRVIGAPMRLAHGALGLVAGDGAVYAFDGDRTP